MSLSLGERKKLYQKRYRERQVASKDKVKLLVDDLRRRADALAADRAAFETEKAAFAANVQARSQQQAVSSTVRPDFRRLLIGPEDSYQVALQKTCSVAEGQALLSKWHSSQAAVFSLAGWPVPSPADLQQAKVGAITRERLRVIRALEHAMAAHKKSRTAASLRRLEDLVICLAVPLQGPGLHKNAFARVDSSKFVKALEVTDETATMYAYGPAHPKRWECAYDCMAITSQQLQHILDLIQEAESCTRQAFKRVMHLPEDLLTFLRDWQKNMPYRYDNDHLRVLQPAGEHSALVWDYIHQQIQTCIDLWHKVGLQAITPYQHAKILLASAPYRVDTEAIMAVMLRRLELEQPLSATTDKPAHGHKPSPAVNSQQLQPLPQTAEQIAMHALPEFRLDSEDEHGLLDSPSACERLAPNPSWQADHHRNSAETRVAGQAPQLASGTSGLQTACASHAVHPITCQHASMEQAETARRVPEAARRQSQPPAAGEAVMIGPCSEDFAGHGEAAEGNQLAVSENGEFRGSVGTHDFLSWLENTVLEDISQIPES